jgi:catechol 2,3-dioxygenase-like lactoylglutathione lyase family enzyme
MAYKWLARTLLFTGVAGMTALMVGCNTTMQSDAKKMEAGGRNGGVRLEHVALNVSDPIKTAQWYVDNLDMKILREGPAPINARFLADRGGNMMLELYRNPPDAVPNYAAMDPLLLHVAFMVDDMEVICRRLIAAGATPVGEITVTAAGDKIAMLRDPWGLAIQFIRRADPMLSQD